MTRYSRERQKKKSRLRAQRRTSLTLGSFCGFRTRFSPGCFRVLGSDTPIIARDALARSAGLLEKTAAHGSEEENPNAFAQISSDQASTGCSEESTRTHQGRH